MGIFVGFILALVLTSCLNHKSRINQFQAYTKKLNEINAIDNPRGINWRIDSDSGYINISRSAYRNTRELYTQKYLVIEVGPSSSFMNNPMTAAPQVVNHTPTIGTDHSPPPAYHESVKNN